MPQPVYRPLNPSDQITDQKRYLRVWQAELLVVFNDFEAGLAEFRAHDANGNLIEDPYKGIDIDYNYLNLPTLITKRSETLEILYSADGTKLQQIKKTGSTVDRTRDYLGGIEYLDTDLDAIYHSEGRLFYGGASTPEYEYHLRDHLGNTRITFADLDDDGIVEETAGELLQENHYYPFGMQIDGPWAMPAAGAGERYRYNGKELVGDLGLGWYDYGARWYDAAVGRWNAVDPLAEKMSSWSPYSYSFDNPVRFIDPDGRMPSDCCGGGGTMPSVAGILYEGYQNAKAGLFNLYQRFGESQRLNRGPVTRMRVNYNADGSIPTDKPTRIVTEQPKSFGGELLDGGMDVLALTPVAELGATRGMSGPFLAARAGGNPVASTANFLKQVNGESIHTAKAGDFQLLHSEEMIISAEGYNDIKNLTDEQLIKSATSPSNGRFITVSGNSGSLIDGNTRIYELQRRGLNDVKVSFTATPNTNNDIFKF